MQYVGGTLDTGCSLDFYFPSAVSKVRKIYVCMELHQMDRAVDPSRQDKSNNQLVPRRRSNTHTAHAWLLEFTDGWS